MALCTLFTDDGTDPPFNNLEPGPDVTHSNGLSTSVSEECSFVKPAPASEKKSNGIEKLEGLAEITKSNKLKTPLALNSSSGLLLTFS